MKHDLRVTVFLILFFFLAQVVGLALINLSIAEISIKDGKPVLVHQETSLGPRPEFTGPGAFFYILIGVAIGTALVLFIIRLGKVKIWKAWFFLAVFFSMSLSLGVLIESRYIVYSLALILSFLKLYRPNVIIHNLTELLMYSGIAVFLVPTLDILWASILLLVIAIYDFIAVFKSKHMVTMAKFQAESQVFAGLFVPYTPKAALSIAPQKKNSGKELPKIKLEKKSAVLGGGDIAFPLIFSGVVMESLIAHGLSKAAALTQSLIITVCVTVALGVLLFFAEKDKFYPAMPFITVGCLAGYAITLLL